MQDTHSSTYAIFRGLEENAYDTVIQSVPMGQYEVRFSQGEDVQNKSLGVMNCRKGGAVEAARQAAGGRGMCRDVTGADRSRP